MLAGLCDSCIHQCVRDVKSAHSKLELEPLEVRLAGPCPRYVFIHRFMVEGLVAGSVKG